MHSFSLRTADGSARRGTLHTAHGDVETPCFMNVGTQAAVKGGLDSADLAGIGCQIELSNTYHLHIRPGDGVIRGLGGLHKFMAWDAPVLTDSGGFQIFSLAGLRKITEEGVAFRSHVDGRRIFMSPEDSVRIQANLGSDVAMAFDECVEIPSPRGYIAKSAELTFRWLVRCRDEWLRQIQLEDAVNPGQLLFGINQGAAELDIRREHMRRIAELDLPGYAIGGLAVGESHSEMYGVIEAVNELAPEDKPRYLMGVGTPANIVEAVARGVDMFDCVLPARNGRHGQLFTSRGVIHIKNARYETDGAPADESCGCPVCAKHSRAYLRHLFKCGEMLGLRLAVTHNLWFYNNLMSEIREAIERGAFESFKKNIAEIYGKDNQL